MAKKLKVEVDIETEKAKQKLRRDLGSSVEASSDGAEISNKASRSIKKLGDEADKTGINMSRVVRAFSGLAVGMATSYAGSHMAEGTARTAVGYLGSAMQYGSMGAMAGGPWGMVAGAGFGIAKEYLDRDSEQTEALKAFEDSEALFKADKAWAEKFEKLTETRDPKYLDEVLKTLTAQEEDLVESIREALNDGLVETAASLQEDLKVVRSRKARAEQIEKSYAKNDKEFRVGTDSSDAISRIGGYFTGGGDIDYRRSMQMGIHNCESYLKQIVQKDGGDKWQ